MRWRKSQGDRTSTSLFGDVLTEVARHADPPSTVSKRQVLRDTWSPRFASVVYEHDGGEATAKTAYVPALAGHPGDSRVGKVTGRMGIGWNGELLTVMSSDGQVYAWTTRAGGVLDEFRGDPERTPGFVRHRGGSSRVAEIAATTSSACAFWLLFLNECGERLADIPIAGFDEPRLIHLANAAGLHYRRCLLDVDMSLIPVLLSSDYFPGAPRPISGSRRPVELRQWLSGQPKT